jgi:hypothetical protein
MPLWFKGSMRELFCGEISPRCRRSTIFIKQPGKAFAGAVHFSAGGGR